MTTTSSTQSAAVIAAKPAQKMHPLLFQFWKARTSYLLLLPFLIPFIVFVIIPIGSSAYLSLTEFTGTKAPNYIGFKNFQDLLGLESKPLTQQVDAATKQLMYQCGTKRLPQDQADAEKANGATCTALLARPAQVLTSGFREIGRLNLFGTTYSIGASDSRFWKAMINTFAYAMVVVPLGILIGLALALVLQGQSILNYILRTVFFLPSVTSVIAVAVVWTYIFHGEDYGLVNGILLQLHIPKVTFLANESWTLPIMMMLALWGGVGYNMILFLAGLQNISAELYEAAAIDGASPQQSLFRITIPLLRPTLVYILITGTITALQVFEAVYVVFRSVETVGGILDSGLTVVPYLYDTGFRHFQLGYASSIAWILFIIIFIITLINLRVGRANQAV